MSKHGLKTLNLGILAHVDAGKTSLTERLLYSAGVIDEVGSVDDGSTRTDTLALERQRGITIKSAVVSFVIPRAIIPGASDDDLDDVVVNLIDTPGHPDFIAEVERVLSVLDGAVLVISAVEGVQAQTRVLMRTLQRLHIPTLIFVNKTDRAGARYEEVLQSIAERLTPSAIAMGSASGLGTRSAGFTPYDEDDVAFTAGLVELLAERDDELLAAYVGDGTTVSYPRLRDDLAAQTGRAVVHPVFFGSAITGAGIDALIAGIAELLPFAHGDVDAPASGTVFKVERGAAGENIGYLRMFSGTVRVRDRLTFRGMGKTGHGAGHGPGEESKVTGISVFDRGSAAQRASVAAGQIGKVWGLGDIRIGDTVGLPSTIGTASLARWEGSQFAPPTLETIVVPRHPDERGALHAALSQLAEQDPLIDVRRDDIQQEISVSLYGEVQKEVIQATLAADFDIQVEFRATTTICVERPSGTGVAMEVLGADSNPFFATVGLRVDPAPVDTGIEFSLDVEHRSIPLFVYSTVRDFRETMADTVQKTLRQGIYGWRVTDCNVTLTHCDYTSPESTAGDFRKLTTLILRRALNQAGTTVCEPIHHFVLDVPTDTLGLILPELARLQAVPRTSTVRGSSYAVEGELPAGRVHTLQEQLPGLTRGEGVLESSFDHYEPVRVPLQRFRT